MKQIRTLIGLLLLSLVWAAPAAAQCSVLQFTSASPTAGAGFTTPHTEQQQWRR